jgi:hypothetical protein
MADDPVSICRICRAPIIGQIAEEWAYDLRTGREESWRMHPHCRDRLVRKMIEMGHRPIDPGEIARSN